MSATSARSRRWTEREVLRTKGQFWTPGWVARAMVQYAIGGGAGHIFDPAVGEGAFFIAAKEIAAERGHALTLLGNEIDPGPLSRAALNGLTASDLAGVRLCDFVLDIPADQYDAIVANPPYIRHHRLAEATKNALRAYSQQLLGRALDGRTGYHVYFLLRALQLLRPGGRLSFIMPADTCEGVFAPYLWHWITSRYALHGVTTFAPDATPFPGVDTNAVVFMIERSAPVSTFSWAKCSTADTRAFETWVLEDLCDISSPQFTAVTRDVRSALKTGLSRDADAAARLKDTIPLGKLAIVRRGIATGANAFFHLTRVHAESLRVPAEYLLPAVGRTRDVPGAELRPEHLVELDNQGRATVLLALQGTGTEQLSAELHAYLLDGERRGLPDRPLIRARRPWYRMERRNPPPFLFAYLGRRNARFIRNLASVVPLTGFLCVYPREYLLSSLDQLFSVLNDPATIANLHLVGKSYGGGAIKVEPRALEQLPVPERLIRHAGILLPPRDGDQAAMFQ